MISFTLKSAVKQMKSFANDKTLTLTAKDESSDSSYVFIVDRNSITVDISSKDLGLRQLVKDVEMLNVPSQVKIISLEEKNFTPDGNVFEQTTVNISYEAQFFIRLFRLMKERVFFRLTHENNIYECYYVDGKVFYVEETDEEYRLMGTDLYKLPTTHEGYRILSMDSILDIVDFRTFIDRQHKAANVLNKTFVRYKYGQRV